MWFLFGFLTILIFITLELWRRHFSRWKPEGVSAGLQFKHVRELIKRNVRYVLIGVDCQAGANFSIKRESHLDSFLKNIGVIKEFETGDSSFDNLVYLISDDKALHSALAKSANFRRIIKEIMSDDLFYGLTATHIHCRNGRLWVQFGARGLYGDKKIIYVPEALSKLLGDLKKVVNEVELISGARWRDPFVIKAAILLAMSSGLAINGVFHLPRLEFVDEFPFIINKSLIVDDAINYCLIILTLFILGALFWLGRSARTHIVLIELLTVGAFGFFASTVVELRDINMEMDISAPKYYETQIVDKYTKKGSGRRSRSRTNYYVVFKDWNCDCGNYQLQVSSSLYRYLPGSGNVIVTQHQGRLGYPWVSNISTR